MVPTDDTSWPESMRGVRLGRALMKMRNNNTHQAIQPELREMGFEVDRASTPFQSVYEALVAFRAIHSHVDVPADFEVPRDARYPVHTHGLLLEKELRKIMNGGAVYTKNRNRLEALGYF